MIPNLVQHFYPQYAFLDWLQEFVNGRVVIEVGAGLCNFTKMMHKAKIKALAIEPRASDATMIECSNFLLTMWAADCNILRTTPAVVIVARPDHSGWFETLLDIIHPESELIYIGLEENLYMDVPEDAEVERLYEGAGLDEEIVLRVS